jgi:hypothetical protein
MDITKEQIEKMATEYAKQFDYAEDSSPFLDYIAGFEKALSLFAVSGSRFQSAYAQYWDMVKDIIDEEGWVYTKEAPHMLDTYFEHNTGKPIEFQKSFGKSGDNTHWLTRGSRWRPTELS